MFDWNGYLNILEIYSLEARLYSKKEKVICEFMSKRISYIGTLPTPIIKWILFLSCLFKFTSSCEQTVLPFINYTVNNGVASSEVYHVMQDSRGFMWFSTDHGVSRYDGYQFKTYTTADGLADNTVFECMEDYKGRIWFRSYSGKLSYYFHDSIYSLPVNEKLKKILGWTHITSLAIDSADNMYISTYVLPFIIKIDLKHNNLITLIRVQDGGYLIQIPGANCPIIGLSCSVYGITLQSLSSPFSVYTLSPQDTVLHKHFTMQLARVNAVVSLMHLQAVNMSDSEIAFSFSDKFIILRNNKVVFMQALKSLITKLSYDKTEKLWIELQDREPFCYNANKLIEQPVFKILKDKQITSVAKDNEGGLWLTSLINGIYYLSSLDFITRTEKDGLPTNKVNAMTIAPDSSLWICTSPGNTITVLKNDSLSYPIIKELKYPASIINNILFSSDKSVWVRSGSGLSIYNNSKELRLIAALPRVEGKDMVENDDGSVWLNCTTEIILVKRAKNSLTLIKSVKVNTAIKKIIKGVTNNLWMATLNGLYNYKNDSLIDLGRKYPVLKNGLMTLHYHLMEICGLQPVIPD